MQGKYKGLILGLIALLILSTLAVGGALAQSPFGVTIFEQNDSGETGSATLTDLGNGKLRVDVTIENAPEGVSQPMHIHEGTCADLNPAPKYPLTSLVNGKSTTEIEATIQSLVDTPHAINGHKSAEEASIYVFCGDIIQGIVMATVTGTPMAGMATAEATTSAEPTATPVMTLPGTGGNTPWNALVLVAIIGAGVLLLGLYMRRAGRGV